MWTLVVWFMLLPADVRAISSVPEFASKAACESAGPPIAKAMLEGAPSEKARVHFICVSNGK